MDDGGKSYKVMLYIFSLIKFDKEEKVLEKSEIDALIKKINLIINNFKSPGTSGERNLNDIKLWSTDTGKFNFNIQHMTYKVWPLDLKKLLAMGNVKIKNLEINDISLGYYHSRLILSMSFNLQGDSFGELRDIRSIMHKLFRELIVRPIMDSGRTLNPPVRMIYSYPLIIIEDGAKSLNLHGTYSDTVYTDATTSFFLKSQILNPNIHIIGRTL